MGSKTSDEKKADNVNVGAAGEHYVAFRLCACNYAVGMTTSGARWIDMMVANPDTGKTITIQVKTSRNAYASNKKDGSYRKWRVGGNRKPADEMFFYAFVDMHGDLKKAPEVFFVPSRDLEDNDFIEIYGKEETGKAVWFCIYEKEGDIAEYKDNWKLIEKKLEGTDHAKM